MKKKIDFEDLLKRQEDSANKLKEIQFGEDPYFMICVLDHWNAPDPNAIFLDLGTLANHTEGHIIYQDINPRDGDLDDAVTWLQYHDGLYFDSFFFETDCYEPENSHGCDG